MRDSEERQCHPAAHAQFAAKVGKSAKAGRLRQPAGRGRYPAPACERYPAWERGCAAARSVKKNGMRMKR